MTNLLFLPNDHLMIWLPPGSAGEHDGASAESLKPAVFARLVESGEWPLLAALHALLEHFIVPPGLVLHARAHARLVLIFPSTPLMEKAPARPAPASLTMEQRAILWLMSQGCTTAQIGKAMHRRRRWVLREIARIKRAFGTVSRAQTVGKGGSLG